MKRNGTYYIIRAEYYNSNTGRFEDMDIMECTDKMDAFINAYLYHKDYMLNGDNDSDFTEFKNEAHSAGEEIEITVEEHDLYEIYDFSETYNIDEVIEYLKEHKQLSNR